MNPTVEEVFTTVPTGKVKTIANEASSPSNISAETLSLILILILGTLGMIIVAVVYFYRNTIFGAAITKQGSSFNINEDNINPNFFGLSSNSNQTKRKSATPKLGDQYATGIFNDGGNLFLEENPTTDRLTLSMSHWQGPATEYQVD